MNTEFLRVCILYRQKMKNILEGRKHECKKLQFPENILR